MRYLGLALLFLSAARPQALEPKPKAADYPVHASTPGLEIGAEYMVRSFGGDRMYIAPNHLVVQLALYPLHKRPVTIDPRTFRLRLNGRKEELFAQTPGMVAASLKYPDWQRQRTMIVTGGMGDSGVVIGRPQRTERFPGDPRPEQGRLPAPPSTDAGIAKPASDAPDPAELVTAQALPEGEIRAPVTGYLYFGYDGKLSKLKSVELLYYPQAESKPLVLRLR